MAASGSLNAIHLPSLMYRCTYCGASINQYCSNKKGLVMRAKMHHARLVSYTGYNLFGAKI